MFSRKTETPKAAEPIAPVVSEEKKPMPEQKLYTIIAKGTVFQKVILTLMVVIFKFGVKFQGISM